MRSLIRALFIASCLAVVTFAAAAGRLDRDVVQGDLGARLDVHLRTLAEKGFSGVLLVSQGEEVVIAKGYGLADREQNIPFTSLTAFDIGSITKQFTGAAIAKLEMQGKLSVEDKLSKHFRGVPPDKADITLYHLLTHSAGVKGDFGGDYQPATREWIVEQSLNSQLLFPPGTGHRYSNAGFSLLAAVVEQVSGQPYEAFLREQLWLPAGMQNTGYRLPKWSQLSVAHGYRGEKDWGTPLEKNWADDGPYWNLRGNGGVLSNVWDLYHWHQALEGEQILSAAAKQKMYTRTVKEGPNARSWYSYGWVLADTQRGTKLIEHNGGNGIFYAEIRRYVDENVVIVAASNRAEDAGGTYIRGILGIVFPPANPDRLR